MNPTKEYFKRKHPDLSRELGILSANDPDYEQNMDGYEEYKENLPHETMLKMIGMNECDFGFFCCQRQLHPDDDYQRIREKIFELYDNLFWEAYNG